MTAAIAVIGALLGTINTIKTWAESLEQFVRDSRQAGERLLRLKNRIQVYEFRVDLWWKFWELEGASDRYMRELWGSRGTDTIVSQLTTIESLCNKFHEALDSFFGDTSLAQQIYNAPSSNALDSTSSRLAVFNSYANSIQSTSSNTQIFSFVRTLNSQAMEWLSQVELLLAELESDALRAYNLRHRQDANTFLTQEQRDMIHAGVLMQMTMEYRDSAEELFKRCIRMATKANMPGCTSNVDLAQGFIKLKVDLMADLSDLDLQKVSFEQDITERYHLLLNQELQDGSPPEVELCILRSVAAIPQTEISPSVLAAYQTALQDNRVAHARCRGSIFCFRPPLEKERLIPGHHPATPLKELLETPNSDDFLLQDRIHLAYKVVECGALLTGTSWLASLRTSHVVRSRLGAGFYYTLDIQPPTPARVISRRSLSVHILLIGTFLIEIGTGMLLKDILSKGEDVLFVLEALKPHAPRIRESAPYTKEEVKKFLIENNLGDSYASAALHCFEPEIRRKCEVLVRSQDGAILQSYREVLQDYFLNIYTP